MILDIGICMSIVTKLLAQVLGLKWQSSDRKDIIAVDGKSQVVVGVIVNTSVVIANAQTYIPFQVINSSSKILLLEMD